MLTPLGVALQLPLALFREPGISKFLESAGTLWLHSQKPPVTLPCDTLAFQAFLLITEEASVTPPPQFLCL